MAEFLGIPKVQYFDTTTGNPLAGGKLYSYEPGPGSTTPKATYSSIADALAATNPNDNPVVLDARGEATVVLSGSTKFVLTDSSGVGVWSVDAVGTTGTNIYDSNGNEILIFASVSPAVNEVTITNAITGESPSITATGGDTNINLTVNPKGTGGIDIGTKIIDNNKNEYLTFTKVASAVNYVNITNAITATNAIISAAGDDTDAGISLVKKGAGKIKIDAVNAPTADGSADYILKTDGSANTSFRSQQSHASAVKGWVVCGVSGNIGSSYNVTSVTDAGAGAISVNWTTPFASSLYGGQCNVISGGVNVFITQSSGQSSSALSWYCTNTAGVQQDPTNWWVSAYGTQ